MLGYSISPERDAPVPHLRGFSLLALILGAKVGRGLGVSPPYVIFHALQLSVGLYVPGSRFSLVQSLLLGWEKQEERLQTPPTAVQMVVLGKFYLATLIVSLLCVWHPSQEQISEASDFGN